MEAVAADDGHADGDFTELGGTSPAPDEHAAAVWSGDDVPADHAGPADHEAGHGEEPAERLDALVGAPPTARRRGRLRRRLRHLRRVREVLMRDLGGFVFELHRSGGDGANPVVAAKLERLAGVDAEIRELEEILADRRPLVVREPGIGGACPTCGELYGSQARFCWACGSEVAPGYGRVPELLAAYTTPRAVEGPAEPAAIETTAEEEPAPEPAREDPGVAEAPSGEDPAATADPDAPTEVHRP